MTEKWELCYGLIKEKIVPALGCTEPIAIALASSRARDLIGYHTPIDRIEVCVSQNILKNAMGVYIPGTELMGVDYAAAIGANSENWEKGLKILEGCSSSILDKTIEIVRKGKVTVAMEVKCDPIYVNIAIFSKEQSARAVISGRHDHFVFLEQNGIVLLNASNQTEIYPGLSKYTASLTIDDIFEFSDKAPHESFELIEEGILLAEKIADDGFNKNYGLQMGKAMWGQKNYRKELMIDIEEAAIARTLSAIDARMGGCQLAVMSNSGSGNQGLTATLPVYTVARMLHISREKTLRSVTLSNMIAIYIKLHLDNLSSLCGAMVAACGGACGLAYLMDYDINVMKSTIVNTIAGITGMICDGAKAGCSIKVATALRCAFGSLKLALNGSTVTEFEGIVGSGVEETIDNLGKLNLLGMKQTDNIILEIMMEKQGGQQTKPMYRKIPKKTPCAARLL